MNPEVSRKLEETMNGTHETIDIKPGAVEKQIGVIIQKIREINVANEKAKEAGSTDKLQNEIVETEDVSRLINTVLNEIYAKSTGGNKMDWPVIEQDADLVGNISRKVNQYWESTKLKRRMVEKMDEEIDSLGEKIIKSEDTEESVRLTDEKDRQTKDRKTLIMEFADQIRNETSELIASIAADIQEAVKKFRQDAGENERKAAAM
jgi:hypothetical protein